MSGPDEHDVPVFAVVGRVNMGKSAVLATLLEIDDNELLRVSPRPEKPRAASRTGSCSAAGSACASSTRRVSHGRLRRCAPSSASTARARPDWRRCGNSLRTRRGFGDEKRLLEPLSPVPVSSTSSIRRNLCATIFSRKWKSSAGPAGPARPAQPPRRRHRTGRGILENSPRRRLQPRPHLRRPPRPLRRTAAAAQGAVGDRGDPPRAVGGNHPAD